MFFFAVWLITNALFTPEARSPSPPKLHGTWLCTIGDWEPDPSDAPNPGRSVSASFLHFCADGRFHMYNVTLRETGRRLYVGPSDGFAEYAGRWKQTPEGIEIKYRFIDSMYVLFPVGKVPDRSEKAESVTVVKGRLRLASKTYDWVNPEKAARITGLPKCHS